MHLEGWWFLGMFLGVNIFLEGISRFIGYVGRSRVWSCPLERGTTSTLIVGSRFLVLLYSSHHSFSRCRNHRIGSVNTERICFMKSGETHRFGVSSNDHDVLLSLTGRLHFCNDIFADPGEEWCQHVFGQWKNGLDLRSPQKWVPFRRPIVKPSFLGMVMEINTEGLVGHDRSHPDQRICNASVYTCIVRRHYKDPNLPTSISRNVTGAFWAALLNRWFIIRDHSMTGIMMILPIPEPLVIN